MRNKKGQIMKGHKLSEEVRLRISKSLKGREISKRHRMRLSKAGMGSKNSNWNGGKYLKKSVHLWVRKKLGRPRFCMICKTSDDKAIYDWANIDHKYRRVLKDWLRLCRACHVKYDMKFNNKYKKK